MDFDFKSVLAAFGMDVGKAEVSRYGTGHINDTFSVAFPENRLVLQRLNSSVFPNPAGVMDNICSVTEFMKGRIEARGGEVSRETLNFIKSVNGPAYYIDSSGNFWRMMQFVSGSTCSETAESNEMLEKCGQAFGRFIGDLIDFPAETLVEVIPDFHNTPERVRQLKESVNMNRSGRLSNVTEEVRFALDREYDASELIRLENDGKLPLRVTHNDTKMSNILLDKKTGEVLCVIDLDTVMPGLAAYDFGDSIRSGATCAAEDEKDPDKVKFSMERFSAYAKGFLKSAGKLLTSEELFSLPVGAKLMTYECGIRFLADYLNGDVYFRTDYPDHNLVRARNQFILVREMERNMDSMHSVISQIMEEINS